MALGQGTAASDGTGKHPNGEYPGQIVRVNGKYVDEQPIYEIYIKTVHGQARKTLWGFTSDDDAKCNPDHAAYDQDHKQKVYRTIAGVKRMILDLGLSKPDEIKEMSWDQMIDDIIWNGGEGQSKLIGRPCHLVLMDHQSGNGKQIIFINAPKGNGKQAPAKKKGQPPKKQQQSAPQEQSEPPPDLQPAPQLDSGGDGPPDLDNIPY